MKRFFIILLYMIFGGCIVSAIEPVKTDFLSCVPQYIRYTNSPGAFCITANGKSASIYVSPEDWPGVVRAVKDLSEDICRVSGVKAEVVESHLFGMRSIIVGTVGKSSLIDRLISEKKLDVSSIEGQWESFLIQVIDNNLVVAGSDKRGTIYGIYDISEKIGVSPWYWWADVPARKSSSLYVKAGRYVQPSPKVKYRGIFINDEWPSFGGWTSTKFGGFNSKMYVHLFELLLRLKANYFWPAMWDTAFNEDDPQNPFMADMYGIIMGTSHHEPMMRAHKEYTRRKAEIGPWDYASNKENIDKFFREGLARNKNYDNIITIGMRGDGDVAMGKGNDKENMKVLQEVIDGQRKIIREVYGKDPAEVPQLWAIFTEVQRYYDKGFTVPDDVLLLFCDNNWGYIRRVGPLKEKKRKGGMGLYYHIDMNGGPWNDRWINTTTIPKLREQFSLAYQTGIDDLWIVNVGDLKPKELPIDFIMRYAWNPNGISADNTQAYTEQWAAQNFGDDCAEEIADMLSKYSKYNLWRKPEVQTPGIFTVVNYHEVDEVDKLWKNIEEKAERMRKRIPKDMQDAYYQLVYYPVVASSGIAQLYNFVTRNHLYAAQGRPLANEYAKRAEELYERDKRLTCYYNDTLADGKWSRMMSDIHINYTQWSMPEKATLPTLKKVIPLDVAKLGVSVEGNEKTDKDGDLVLPMFDVLMDQTFYIDLFNRGKGKLEFIVTTSQPWIKVDKMKGSFSLEERLFVSIDWKAIKEGKYEGKVSVSDGVSSIPILIHAIKREVPQVEGRYFGNFSGNEFSIPADGYHRNVPGEKVKWTLIPDLGRDKSCMGIPEITNSVANLKMAPRLEYQVLLADTGEVTLCIGILPTQDIYPERGLRLGIGLDDETRILDARQGLYDIFQEYTKENLAQSPTLKPVPPVDKSIRLTGYGQYLRNEVFDNLRWLTVRLDVKYVGIHTLKVFMIDPEVVLERIVVNPNNLYPSYFGAPVVSLEKRETRNGGLTLDYK